MVWTKKEGILSGGKTLRILVQPDDVLDDVREDQLKFDSVVLSKNSVQRPSSRFSGQPKVGILWNLYVCDLALWGTLALANEASNTVFQGNPWPIVLVQLSQSLWSQWGICKDERVQCGQKQDQKRVFLGVLQARTHIRNGWYVRYHVATLNPIDGWLISGQLSIISLYDAQRIAILALELVTLHAVC